MKIGNRSVKHLIYRITDIDNYKSILRFFNVHKNPFTAIKNEFFGKGAYPKNLPVKTPTGVINLHVRSVIDFSTLNCMFCRKDYYAPEGFKTVVDIGSNVGFSSAFWLSRNTDSYVYAFEPNPFILASLENNLKQFGKRYEISQSAVSAFSGETSFYVENTGLYSSMDEIAGEKITVKVVDINEILERVIKERGRVDILKIDSEGQEIPTIQAIDPKFWEYINCINIGDAHGVEKYVPSIFKHSIVSSADRFIRKQK